MDSLKFSLKEFEGTLDLLLALIQKQELDLLTIPIGTLTQQLGKQVASINACADSMALTATLLLLKSRKLLPSEEEVELEEEEIERLALIEQLLAYCRLKEAAKELTKREQAQQAYFLREPALSDALRPTGLTEVSLPQLAQRLQQIIDRKAANHHQIIDEQWHVAPQLERLKGWLKEGPLRFDELFNETKCRGELIVTFLALLELIKHGDVSVTNEDETWVMKLIS